MSNLKTEHEIEIDQIHDRQLAEKDAEIERLKNIIAATEVERDAADKVCETLKAANASFEGGMHWRNGLITELCDALYDHLGPVAGKSLTPEEKLITRAREATR